MSRPAPLLLVYDAESAPCRGLVDWARQRDRDCLIVAFPMQNGELAQLAPELAGLALRGEVHSLDTRTRAVKEGPELLTGLFSRLPAWSWLAPLVALPAVAKLAYRLLCRSR